MKNIYKILLGLTLCLTTISCEKTFLDEKSESSLTPENAFNSNKDFEASVNNLYRLVRLELYSRNDFQPWDYAYRTDIGFPITASAPNLSADYNAVNGFSNGHWNPYFKIIAEANTIIGRVPTSKLTDAQKKEYEARCFKIEDDAKKRYQDITSIQEEDINRKQNRNSPHGVAGPLPYPVRHGAILLQLLAQLSLDDKCLVGTL